MERLAVVLDNMVMDKTSLNDTRSTSYAFSIRTLKYFMGICGSFHCFQCICFAFAFSFLPALSSTLHLTLIN